MNRRPIIIDCDPGVDDAIAILLALRAPEFDLRALTPVAGNVPLDRTAPNALSILELAGARVPVYRGAEKPMFCELHTAAEIHGADGLHGFTLPEPKTAYAEGHAWDAIYREARALGGELEIIAVGPLTNLGIAFSKYPDLPRYLKKITIMGGAVAYGNTTSAAEFNIYADPEAAEMVFRAGVPIAMCGLDVTHQSCLLPEEIDEIAAQPSPQARYAAKLLGYTLSWKDRYHSIGAVLHDPCALIYALDPSMFESKRCWIGVETKGPVTRGKTVTDCYSDAKKEPNADLVTGVDRARFAAKVRELLAAY